MAKGNEPWIRNYPPLQAWLDKHNAHCLWQTRADGRAMNEEEYRPRSYVEGWMVNGRVVVIVVHADKHGWEIHTACRTTMGVTRFKVVVKAGPSEMGDAMKIVFRRFGAKTSEDLPKPFDMRRCDDEVLVK